MKGKVSNENKTEYLKIHSFSDKPLQLVLASHCSRRPLAWVHAEASGPASPASAPEVLPGQRPAGCGASTRVPERPSDGSVPPSATPLAALLD